MFCIAGDNIQCDVDKNQCKGQCGRANSGSVILIGRQYMCKSVYILRRQPGGFGIDCNILLVIDYIVLFFSEVQSIAL